MNPPPRVGASGAFWQRIRARYGAGRRLLGARAPLVLFRPAAPALAGGSRPVRQTGASRPSWTVHVHVGWPGWPVSPHANGSAVQTRTILRTALQAPTVLWRSVPGRPDGAAARPDLPRVLHARARAGSATARAAAHTSENSVRPATLTHAGLSGTVGTHASETPGLLTAARPAASAQEPHRPPLRVHARPAASSDLVLPARRPLGRPSVKPARTPAAPAHARTQHSFAGRLLARQLPPAWEVPSATVPRLARQLSPVREPGSAVATRLARQLSPVRELGSAVATRLARLSHDVRIGRDDAMASLHAQVPRALAAPMRDAAEGREPLARSMSPAGGPLFSQPAARSLAVPSAPAAAAPAPVLPPPPVPQQPAPQIDVARLTEDVYQNLRRRIRIERERRGL
jgi:hypothetical protein